MPGQRAPAAPPHHEEFNVSVPLSFDTAAGGPAMAERDLTELTDEGRLCAVKVAIAEMALRAWEADAAERRRRHVVRLIDLAIEECEELNLASTTWCRPAAPAWVLGLVEWLQAAAGLPAEQPRNCREAPEALLDLQAEYLPDPPVPHSEEEAWLAGGGGLELPA
jgi:hypothetical protein